MAKYYLPRPGQGRLSQWFRTLRTRGRERPRPAFPRAVQFQTVSWCNARCLFCGYPETHDTLPQGVMDEDLFRKIADECGRHFVGRISPYLMNEPLMDKKLPERLAYLNRAKQPFTKTKINSNGFLLTEDMSLGLIESGLRHLWISVQGYSEESYKASMGLKLDVTLGNIDRFLELRERKRATYPKLTVTTVRTKYVDPELEYARAYWADRGVVFKVHTPDNRSGKDVSEFAVTKAKLRRRCDLFLKQAYILYNGDMILCCHDWRRTVVLGNVGETSIREIWNSPGFLEVIRGYQAGDFSKCEICRTCTST
jgi:MoaA/NifB/PqqE/SkfB family radical SAM enzyme